MKTPEEWAKEVSRRLEEEQGIVFGAIHEAYVMGAAADIQREAREAAIEEAADLIDHYGEGRGADFANEIRALAQPGASDGKGKP